MLNRRQFTTRAAAAAAGLAAAPTVPTILLASSADQWGDLVGRFVYDAPPPGRAKLKVDKDLDCCGKFDIQDRKSVV